MQLLADLGRGIAMHIAIQPRALWLYAIEVSEGVEEGMANKPSGI